MVGISLALLPVAGTVKAAEEDAKRKQQQEEQRKLAEKQRAAAERAAMRDRMGRCERAPCRHTSRIQAHAFVLLGRQIVTACVLLCT